MYGWNVYFLILSGYGLYCSYVKKDFDNWWDRKITNIFLPAMMIQIVWLLSFSIYSYLKSNIITISWITLVTDILCISQHNSIDGSMWYLSYLLFCYAVFYFFFRFFKEKIAFPLFVIFWFLLAPIAKSAYMNNWYCISSFMIGVILGKITSTCEIQINVLMKVAGIILSIIVGVCYFLYPIIHWLIDTITSLSISMGFILFVSLLDCTKFKILKFIGTNSFILYLLQGKTIYRFSYDVFKPGISRVSAFIVLLVISILLSDIINKKINKQLEQ